MLYDPKWNKGLDLTKPSLIALSYVLRHRELWPKDFTWNYSHCKQCAMGLANQLWALFNDDPGVVSVYKVNEILSQSLDLSVKNVNLIFWDGAGLKISDWKKITPEMIAGVIDKYV